MSIFMNRKLIFCWAFFACLVFVLPAMGQDYSKMNLHFVYIDHETTTPVNRLCQRLRTLRDDALEVEDALIVYLSDGAQSPVSITNLKDESGHNRDANDSFTTIIAALQDYNSHSVVATMDRTNILNLFDEFSFVDANGKLRFNSVIMDFYVGSGFWSLNNNEKVIAHIFTVLDVAKYPKEKLSFNLYKAKEDNFHFTEDMPFGDNNIDGINSKLKIFEY